MNELTLLQAIGGISDKHISDYSEPSSYRSRKNLVLKRVWMSAAAVVILAFAGITAINIHEQITVPFTENNGKSSAPSHAGAQSSATTDEQSDSVVELNKVFIIDGDYYELVSNAEILKKHGLPAIVTEEMKGEKVGNYLCENDHRMYEVFEYPGFAGRSVYIVKYGSDHHFILCCNPRDINAKLTFSDIIDIYGLSDNVTSVKIADKQLTQAETDTFINYMENTQSFSASEFYSSDIPFSADLTIIISGQGTDILTVEYDSANGYYYAANNYYKLPEETGKLFK